MRVASGVLLGAGALALLVACGTREPEAAVCASPPSAELLATAGELVPQARVDAALSAASVARGATLYAAECARCHAPMVPAGREYPRLDCAPFQTAATDHYLFAVVSEGGKPFGKRGVMRAFSADYDDAALGDLIVFLRSIATDLP